MSNNYKNTINTHERVEILKKVSIFADTEPSVLAEIADATNERTLKPEQVLFKKGDVGKDMYIIVEGAVRVHDGNYVFAVLRQGQVFGEYSIIESDAKSRAASVSAIVQTRLLELSQDVFYSLMSNRIEIVKGILNVLIKRSRRQNYFEEKMNEQSRELEKQRDLIAKEKETSEKLLLNILPSDVAEELKAKGRADVRQYELVSVLFADIKGFTESSQVLSPAEVVTALEFYFTAYDGIIQKYNIEKIKTMGDAYMCAGGIPKPNKTNPIDLTLAAIEMQHFMKDYNQSKERDANIPPWELRLGINTGPLIAGVIGKSKFVYDIWGDTVNTAARMETTGVVNEINVSGDTYHYIKDLFVCEPRGKINAKGKGEVEMFFVKGIKPELSLNQEGIKPNEAFQKALLDIKNS